MEIYRLGQNGRAAVFIVAQGPHPLVSSNRAEGKIVLPSEEKLRLCINQGATRRWRDACGGSSCGRGGPPIGKPSSAALCVEKRLRKLGSPRFSPPALAFLGAAGNPQPDAVVVAVEV